MDQSKDDEGTLTFKTAGRYNTPPVGVGFPPAPANRLIRTEDLKGPPFDAPVATLLDLWINKYGHAWVDVDAVMQDPFYSLAYARLKALGEVEVHYLTDRAIYVCRKPEK
jgi:hypothetical protein